MITTNDTKTNQNFNKLMFMNCPFEESFSSNNSNNTHIGYTIVA